MDNQEKLEEAKRLIHWYTSLCALEHFFHDGSDHEFAKTLLSILDKNPDTVLVDAETTQRQTDFLNSLLRGNSPPVTDFPSFGDDRLNYSKVKSDFLEATVKFILQLGAEEEEDFDRLPNLTNKKGG